MKKFILPIFLILFSLFLPTVLFAQEVSQGKKITCEEASKIINSADCPFWAAEKTSVWCYQEEYKGGTLDELRAYMRSIRSRTPDYILEKNFDLCDWPQTDQKTDSEESSQQDLGQQTGTVKQNYSQKSGSPFNIFGFNPFETWRNIAGLLDIPKGFISLVQTAEIISGPVEIKINIPNPSISTDSEGNLWNFLPGYVPPEKGKVSITSGQGEMKPSDFDQFMPVSGTDDTATNTFVGSTFKNSGKDASQFSYIWNTNSGAVINVFPQAEVQFVEPVLGEDARGTKRIIKLNKGDIEVKVKNTNAKNKFGVQTDFLELIVIGTHFWMSYDPVLKKTVVGVYEGKVEINTKDGKNIMISPNGDKPGVVVVTQKLSPIKLGLVGGILAAIVGGIFIIWKKKFNSQNTKKKK